MRAARDSSLVVSFQGMPFHERICFRPPLLAKPVMAGTLPARITSPVDNNIYGELDDHGRYTVKFLFDPDSWPLGAESKLLRLARPYAGETYGLHLPLVTGTEVAVAFEQGAPDRPYIAHALHDSEHPDHVAMRNDRRNVLRTPANNKLRMEDHRGQEHIKLSTEYAGKSQLNLGHLVDGDRKKRGEGFELRSDGWGAIRAGKGVFISADEQNRANGPVLDMASAIGRLRDAGEQLASLSEDAEKSAADPADVQAQLALVNERLDQLKAAVALLSAPDGMALSSGKDLQIAAQSNLVVSAGRQADVSVVRRLFVGVGQGLSIFVRKLGIKMIANQGAVVVQAQNDSLQLLARQGLQITSTEDEIHITAKKRIVLNAAGSYISLDQHSIESGTTGDFLVKAAHFEHTGAASKEATHPQFPQSLSSQKLRLRVPLASNAPGRHWAGMPYTIFADGALVTQGVLDSSGQFSIDHQVVTRSYTMKMANGQSFEIPVPEDYRNPEQGALANEGLHHHHGRAHPDVSPPVSHTEHRQHYASLNKGLDPKAPQS
jgi:type VI secretion system secreted protein VgrG